MQINTASAARRSMRRARRPLASTKTGDPSGSGIALDMSWLGVLIAFHCQPSDVANHLDAPFPAKAYSSESATALLAATSLAMNVPSSLMVLMSGAGKTTVVFLSTPISTSDWRLRN